jgi:hypothetical protein
MIMDILLPVYPEASYEGWIGFEFILPNGYRHVASVERPASDGVMGHGEMWDLGQNAEGKFRLFRRGTGEVENSHIGRGEPHSDVDLKGFGLTADQIAYEPGEVEWAGSFSTLCKSNLIVGS